MYTKIITFLIILVLLIPTGSYAKSKSTKPTSSQIEAKEVLKDNSWIKTNWTNYNGVTTTDEKTDVPQNVVDLLYANKLAEAAKALEKYYKDNHGGKTVQYQFSRKDNIIAIACSNLWLTIINLDLYEKTPELPAIDGKCKVEGTLSSKISAGSCLIGTPSGFKSSGTNPISYSWSCSGENGGASKSCKADYSAAECDPTVANNTLLTSHFSTPKCKYGNVVNVSQSTDATNKTTYTWSCEKAGSPTVTCKAYSKPPCDPTATNGCCDDRKKADDPTNITQFGHPPRLPEQCSYSIIMDQPKISMTGGIMSTQEGPTKLSLTGGNLQSKNGIVGSCQVPIDGKYHMVCDANPNIDIIIDPRNSVFTLPSDITQRVGKCTIVSQAPDLCSSLPGVTIQTKAFADCDPSITDYKNPKYCPRRESCVEINDAFGNHVSQYATGKIVSVLSGKQVENTYFEKYNAGKDPTRYKEGEYKEVDERYCTNICVVGDPKCETTTTTQACIRKADNTYKKAIGVKSGVNTTYYEPDVTGLRPEYSKPLIGTVLPLANCSYSPPPTDTTIKSCLQIIDSKGRTGYDYGWKKVGSTAPIQYFKPDARGDMGTELYSGKISEVNSDLCGTCVNTPDNPTKCGTRGPDCIPTPENNYCGSPKCVPTIENEYCGEPPTTVPGCDDPEYSGDPMECIETTKACTAHLEVQDSNGDWSTDGDAIIYDESLNYRIIIDGADTVCRNGDITVSSVSPTGGVFSGNVLWNADDTFTAIVVRDAFSTPISARGPAVRAVFTQPGGITYGLTARADDFNDTPLTITGDRMKGVRIIGAAGTNITSFNLNNAGVIGEDSSTSTINMRNAVLKNVGILTRGIEPNEPKSINGIYYAEGDYTYTQLVGMVSNGFRTVILRGNLTIDTSFPRHDSTDPIIGVIVVRNAVGNKGNIIIKNDVTSMRGVLFAEGSLYAESQTSGSLGDISRNKLVLKGSLFSRNTIGGSADPAHLYISGGVTTTDFVAAFLQDLNNVRNGYGCTAGSEGCYKNYPDPFIIEYENTLSDPPPGFSL